MGAPGKDRVTRLNINSKAYFKFSERNLAWMGEAGIY